jgi:hypothetical protein
MKSINKSGFSFLSFYPDVVRKPFLVLIALKIFLSLLFGILLLFLHSCKKLVAVPPPENSITTTQSFSSDALAKAAMTGVYYNMINANGDNFFNGAITIYTGTSSDELSFFLRTVQDNIQFNDNNVTAINGRILNSFWNNAYSIIYSANAVIDGLNISGDISDSVKNELIGEAKFVRALCNFYLTNLFGDIPVINDINWRNSRLLSRTSTTDVYQQIVSDLLDAQSKLTADFSVGKGQRIIPTKWAASALLARAYLYLQRWTNAEEQSNTVISNTTLFSLVPVLKNVFKPNNSEAIWQLQQSNTTATYNATNEGYRIIPYDATSRPFIYLTDTLLKSFESDDERRSDWVDSTIYNSITYYYPKKYTTGSSQSTPNGAYNEYYMVLRLAEQYLIRAEARAQQNKLPEAISDLNEIRFRAGLQSYSGPTDNRDSIMHAIIREKQVEFFAEWAHRWFDLKRWNEADEILGQNKGANWQTTDQLYPIPLREIQSNPNLTQNLGY